MHRVAVGKITPPLLHTKHREGERERQGRERDGEGETVRERRRGGEKGKEKRKERACERENERKERDRDRRGARETGHRDKVGERVSRESSTNRETDREKEAKRESERRGGKERENLIESPIGTGEPWCFSSHPATTSKPLLDNTVASQLLHVLFNLLSPTPSLFICSLPLSISLSPEAILPSVCEGVAGRVENTPAY